MASPQARAAFASALAIVLAVELAPRALKWASLPREEDFPEVYRWIAGEPSVKAVIELPIYKDVREARYIYYSTLHWKPIANGFSGYDPPSHHRLTSRIRFLPDPAGLDLMRELWISHMVVHARSPLRREALRKWEQQLAMGPDRQVELVYRSRSSSVFRVLDEPASSSTPKRAGL